MGRHTDFLNGVTTCDPFSLDAERVIKAHEQATGRKVEAWTLKRALAKIKAEKVKKCTRRSAS